ncbi:hypothetical protein NL676_034816 [Syzygium grande]|nr:hypothetical protein NL676_034816 [Syzygium grande]
MTEPTWKQSILYLASIYAILYLVHSSILHKLLLGHEKLHVKRSPVLPLRFRSDGTFKILQVADMHYANGVMTRCRDVLASEFGECSDLNTTRFVRRLIESEKPDFIAFTGDNIFGPSTSDAAESLFGAFVPAVESQLPWAAILGNHDQESTMDREELMSFISLMDYSVSQINPSHDDLATSDIDGYGNYHLGVHGPPGSKWANSSILNLFFLDSGDRAVVQGIRTYGWIKESQLQWLVGLSEKLRGGRLEETDALSPALAFFHIPIPEVRQLYYQKIVGQFQEAVACSSINSGVLKTFLSMGDVKAFFVGHDHTNDFCGLIDGIWACYGGGCGYHGFSWTLDQPHEDNRSQLLDFDKRKVKPIFSFCE